MPTQQDQDQQRDLAEKNTKLTSTCLRLKTTIRIAGREHPEDDQLPRGRSRAGCGPLVTGEA
jgi:hypothetical protein